MAVTILPRGESLGEALGTGLGSGLSKGIQALTKHKMEGMEKQNMLSTLLGANVPQNVANAIVNAPKSLQREMFKPLLEMNKDVSKTKAATPEVEGVKSSMSDLLTVRKHLLENVKSGQLPQEAIKNELLESGVAEEEINVLLGAELNDDIVRYFLDKTNNDPKKARALAKKFGYKV